MRFLHCNHPNWLYLPLVVVGGMKKIGNFMIYCDFPKGRRNIQSSKILGIFFSLGFRTPDIKSVEIGEKYHSISGPSGRFLWYGLLKRHLRLQKQFQ